MTYTKQQTENSNYCVLNNHGLPQCGCEELYFNSWGDVESYFVDEEHETDLLNMYAVIIELQERSNIQRFVSVALYPGTRMNTRPHNEGAGKG